MIKFPEDANLYRGISSRDQIFGRRNFGALLVQYLIAGY